MLIVWLKQLFSVYSVLTLLIGHSLKQKSDSALLAPLEDYPSPPGAAIN